MSDKEPLSPAEIIAKTIEKQPGPTPLLVLANRILDALRDYGYPVFTEFQFIAQSSSEQPAVGHA